MKNNSSDTLPFVVINGSVSDQVSVFDRGFQYGDGLFETIAIVNGNPALLTKHLSRLSTGLQKLGFPEVNIESLQKDIIRYSEQLDLAILKLTVTRGISERGYKAPDLITPTVVLSFFPYNKPSDITSQDGIEITLCRTPTSVSTSLAGLKHLNRLDQVLARNEWSGNEIADGLMCDSDGYVIEATSANIFLWKDDQLFTPKLSRSGVAGVVRELVIESAESLSIPCSIEDISVEACHDADCLFLTNSLSGILPVKKFQSTVYKRSNCPETLFVKVMQHVFT